MLVFDEHTQHPNWDSSVWADSQPLFLDFKASTQKSLSPAQARFSLTVRSPIMSKGQRHHSVFYFRETLCMLVQGHWLAWIFFFFISGGDEHQPDLPRKAYAAELTMLSPWHFVHKKNKPRKGTRPWSSFSVSYILIWLRNLLIIQTEGLLIYLSVSFPYIAHSHAMALHTVPCSASLSGF